jgi:RNA polymerase sigma factor (sigma-70 family)
MTGDRWNVKQQWSLANPVRITCLIREEKRMVEAPMWNQAMILRLRAGDVEALGELYDRFATPILRTALALTASERAAERALHHSLLYLFYAAPRIDPAAPLVPLIYREVVLRSHASGGIVQRLLCTDRMLAHRGEDSAQIYHVIQRLPRQQRVVIVLYFVTRLSIDEIAGVMRCDMASVERHLGQARRRLRQVAAGAVLFGSAQVHRG